MKIKKPNVQHITDLLERDISDTEKMENLKEVAPKITYIREFFIKNGQGRMTIQHKFVDLKDVTEDQQEDFLTNLYRHCSTIESDGLLALVQEFDFEDFMDVSHFLATYLGEDDREAYCQYILAEMKIKQAEFNDLEDKIIGVLMMG